MPFSETDFQNIETRTKLITIINDEILIHPLTKISTLTKRQLLTMNAKMNEYIKNLPEEFYLEKIDKDFNFVMEDVFEKMKLEECFIPLVNSDVVLLGKEVSVE